VKHCATCGNAVRAWVCRPVNHYGPPTEQDQYWCLRCVADGKSPLADYWADYARSQLGS
jgi:hypothetical protein